MALKYRVRQRVNPSNPESDKKFYAQAVTKGEVSLRELASEIADMSTVSKVDTMAVIEAFIHLVPKHLCQGEIIRLGDFGSYAIGLLSKGADSEDQFSDQLIRGVKVYFRPGRELKKTFSTIDFKKEP